ncbi:MAG: TlpA disulfide reductase family protein, partial [Phycisphaeraceae bacterium]
AEIRMELALADWRFDEPIDEARFNYEPADGATQAASYGELLEARQGGDPADQLAGQRAPGFKLEQLAGGEVDLADHLGEDIVILDFWATWCGPCVQTMPIYQRIMEDYADRNVQIYAINLQEGEDQVVAFLEEHELALPVLFDRQGRVARDYHARAIPQSVLIGPDGTVQAVHVGAIPTLEEQLRRELDTLLAGDSLVE